MIKHLIFSKKTSIILVMLCLFSAFIARAQQADAKLRMVLKTIHKTSGEGIPLSVIEVVSANKTIGVGSSDFDGFSVVNLQAKDIINNSITLRVNAINCKPFEQTYTVNQDIKITIKLEKGTSKFKNRKEREEFLRKTPGIPIDVCGTDDVEEEVKLAELVELEEEWEFVEIEGQLVPLKEKLIQLERTLLDFKFPIDSTGFSKFKHSKFLKNGNAVDFIIQPKNTHVIDFNKDGLQDIIYQNTEHYTETILFINNGSSFIEIYTTPGKLIDIQLGDKTLISIFSNAIGCFEKKIFSYVTIDTYNVMSTYKLWLHYETIINNLDSSFTQRKVTGILRTQPIVDNQHKEEICTREPRKGNQIDTLINQPVTVIKQQDNWLLVLYEKTTKETNYATIGWIKN